MPDDAKKNTEVRYYTDYSTGVGGWLDPLDDWTPGPNILGQMDRGSIHTREYMDPSLEEWTPCASIDDRSDKRNCGFVLYMPASR